MGGAERVVRQLHLGLLNGGYSSEVVGLFHNSPTEDRLPKAKTLGIDSPYSIVVMLQLLRLMRQKDGSEVIFHVHLFPSLLYVALFKRLGLLTAKVVATEHSTSNGRRNKWYGRLLDQFIFTSYQKVFAISQGVKSSLLQRGVVAPKKVKVIQNGAALYFKKPLPRSYKLPLQLVSVGSLRAAKNYQNFIRALAKVSFKDWHYTIAGQGEDRARLKQLIRGLGLEEKITLAGRVDPVYPLLKKAHLFVMPSAWEGFGLAAVEAMNASLPVVLSDVPGLKELVTEDKEILPFARLIEPTDTVLLQKQLEAILPCGAELLSHSKQAFTKAQSYSMEKMVLTYSQSYPLI
jgi:glycosyltransferase involved in cell wall biosynthesis